MNTLNSGSRLATMFLDHLSMTFVIMIVAAPGAVYDILQTMQNPDAPPKLMLGNLYMNVLAFSLYFNKDIVSGRSLAKRALKFQVVDIKTNQPANSLKCLVRNLTIPFWPIEVIAGLVNNERRIGDYIAGTKLVIYDPQQHGHQLNWLQMILAIVASMLVTYLVMFLPMELLFNALSS